MTGHSAGAPFSGLSTGEVALGTLLDDSAHLRPDELPAAVRRKAALIGLQDATIFLIDKEQRLLIPFPANDGEAIPVESVAGRAFQRSETVVSDRAAAEGVQVWFPLLNGRSRLGVLGGRVVQHDALLLTRGRQLAALTAELLSGKSDYGDHIHIAQRLHEMSLAAEMRWALLPPLSFTSPDLSIAGYLVPAYEIAGDAFDYAINGNTAHVAVFDARGHGLTASRIANLAVASYRHTRRTGGSITQAYLDMDEIIESEFGGEVFTTAQLATLDLPDGRFQWINGGHPPPLLLREGHIHELGGDAAVPAGIGAVDAPLNEMRLEPGDTIAFYSDGVTEARSPSGEQFGVQALGEFLVRAAAAHQTAPETARRLIHAVLEHTAGDERNLADDATAVLMSWRP